MHEQEEVGHALGQKLFRRTTCRLNLQNVQSEIRTNLSVARKTWPVSDDVLLFPCCLLHKDQLELQNPSTFYLFDWSQQNCNAIYHSTNYNPYSQVASSVGKGNWIALCERSDSCNVRKQHQILKYFSNKINYKICINATFILLS